MIPPWLIEIKKNVGDSESNALPEIIGFIEEVDPSIDYRVAWCAAAARHFIKKAGFDVTGITLAAASFLHWGVDIGDNPQDGCIVVFHWSSGPDAGGRHVTFYDDKQDDTDNDHIAAIGGNQSRMIKRSIYPVSDVESYRMPKNYKI